MRPEFELWQGITISSTKDDVRQMFPNAIGENPIVLADIEVAGCEFQASVHFDERGLKKVELDLFRHPSSMGIPEVRQNLTTLLSAKYGKGDRRIEIGNVVTKRWDQRYVRVVLTSVDDPEFPTISIEYFPPLFQDLEKL